MEKRFGRRAFTLVELLVVITIIGILIAMLLPAIQAARRSARTVECKNNMGNLAKAILSYRTAENNHFPPSSYNGHTWVTYILIYMEQDSLFQTMDMSHGWAHQNNRVAIQQQLPIMKCPSTTRIKKMGKCLSGSTQIPCAVGDYAIPTGFHKNSPAYTQAFKDRVKKTAGITQGGKNRTFIVPDGESNTIMVMEDSGRERHWNSYGYGPDNTSHGLNFVVENGLVRGAGWADTARGIPVHSFNRKGTACPGRCIMNCTNNNEPFSFHPDGMNISFADGRVQFVREEIFPDVFASMITRKGGETVDMSFVE